MHQTRHWNCSFKKGDFDFYSVKSIKSLLHKLSISATHCWAECMDQAGVKRYVAQ